MKKRISLLILVVSVSLAFGQTADKKPAAPAAQAPDAGYAFGLLVGTSIKETGVAIDYNSFLKGLKESMEGKPSAMTPEQAEKVVQDAITAAAAKMGEANVSKEADFLAANAKKPGVIATASGLQYEVLKEGTGDKPKATDNVRVDYVGTLLDGTVFDSSIARGQPAEFPLNGVIPGWTEALQLMKVGGKSRLYIPSSLAYGPRGAGKTIPPNSTLIFDVDLLAILPPASPAGQP